MNKIVKVLAGLKILTIVFIGIPTVSGELSGDSAKDDIFYQASRIEDSVSVKLNSANYRHFFTEISNPWLVFFYESLQAESLLAYKEWVDFTLNSNSDIKFGIIDFSFEKILPNKLKIPLVPCYMFIIDGYIYYYTGNQGKVNLERIIFEQTYLQYNRRILVLNEYQEEPLLSLKKSYTSNPGLLILILFSIFFTYLSFIKCLITNRQSIFSFPKLKKD